MPTKKTTKPATKKPAKKAAKPTVKKMPSPKVKELKLQVIRFGIFGIMAKPIKLNCLFRV